MGRAILISVIITVSMMLGCTTKKPNTNNTPGQGTVVLFGNYTQSDWSIVAYGGGFNYSGYRIEYVLYPDLVPLGNGCYTYEAKAGEGFAQITKVFDLRGFSSANIEFAFGNERGGQISIEVNSGSGWVGASKDLSTYCGWAQTLWVRFHFFGRIEAGGYCPNTDNKVVLKAWIDNVKITAVT